MDFKTVSFLSITDRTQVNTNLYKYFVLIYKKFNFVLIYSIFKNRRLKKNSDFLLKHIDMHFYP